MRTCMPRVAFLLQSCDALRASHSPAIADAAPNSVVEVLIRDTLATQFGISPGDAVHRIESPHAIGDEQHSQPGQSPIGVSAEGGARFMGRNHGFNAPRLLEGLKQRQYVVPRHAEAMSNADITQIRKEKMIQRIDFLIAGRFLYGLA